MASLADENAKLEAQRAHFASDGHIREEVAPWAAMTPEQRLAEAYEMCKAGDYFWSQLDDATRARIRESEALPPDTIALLERLRAQR